MLKYKLTYLFVIVLCCSLLGQESSRDDLYHLKENGVFTKHFHYELMGSPVKVKIFNSESIGNDSLKIQFKAYLFWDKEWKVMSEKDQIQNIYSGYRKFFKYYKKSLLEVKLIENNLREIVIHKDSSFIFIQNIHLYTKIKLSSKRDLEK